MRSFLRSILPLLALLPLVAGCGSDDPVSPDTRTRDTDPPGLLGHSPRAFQIGTNRGSPIVIRFDEAMDPTTAAGAVSLSTTDTPDLSWIDDSTLQIDPPFGTENWVTVRVDDRITDRAGNPLGSPIEFSYAIASPHFQCLGTLPIDGAVGVNRNVRLVLQFNEEPDLDDLDSRLLVEVEIEGQNHILATSSETSGVYGQTIVTIEDDLPEDQLVRVTVRRNTLSTTGVPLAFDKEFSFTTGQDIDRRAPALVRIEPSPTRPIPAGTRSLAFEFSEPMDTSNLVPSHVSLQLAAYMKNEGLLAVWSGDRTTWILPLPEAMPAGLPILVEFDTLADAAGNVAESGLSVRTTIEGVGDPLSFVHGREFGFVTTVRRHTEAGSNISESLDRRSIERIDAATVRILRWDPNRETQIGYDEYRRDGGSTSLVASAEADPNGGFEVITYDPGIPQLREPVTYGSWTGTTTFTEAGVDGVVEYRLSFIALEDVDPEGHAHVFGVDEGGQIESTALWSDTWRFRVETTSRVDGEVVGTSDVTSWYAPGIGIARRVSEFVDARTNTRTETTWRLFDLWLTP